MTLTPPSFHEIVLHEYFNPGPISANEKDDRILDLGSQVLNTFLNTPRRAPLARAFAALPASKPQSYPDIIQTLFDQLSRDLEKVDPFKRRVLENNYPYLKTPTGLKIMEQQILDANLLKFGSMVMDKKDQPFTAAKVREFLKNNSEEVREFLRDHIESVHNTLSVIPPEVESLLAPEPTAP